jgi:hypothetical protein
VTIISNAIASGCGVEFNFGVSTRVLKWRFAMADFCSSVNCTRPIEPGQRMVQVARGYWYEGHITPTLEHVDSEWHEGCYEGDFDPQSLPYTCAGCDRRIRHGEYVSYVTVGYAPEESYSRAERRGYQLALVEHVRCPAARAANR